MKLILALVLALSLMTAIVDTQTARAEGDQPDSWGSDWGGWDP